MNGESEYDGILEGHQGGVQGAQTIKGKKKNKIKKNGGQKTSTKK